jgi:membrane protease YdiL (CAAX protease family)
VLELPEEDELAQEDKPPPRSVSRPRPTTDVMYIVLLMLAVFGVMIPAMQAPARNISEPSALVEFEPKDASVAEAEMEAMLEKAVWLQAIILVAFVLGVVLLLVYAGLRISGLRPVRQVPLNNVTWTLGSLIKGFVMAVFIVMVLSYVGGPLVSPLGLHTLAVAALITAIFELLVMAWVMLMLRFEYDAKPADFGLRFKTPLRDIGYAFLTYLAVLPLFTAAAYAWQHVGEFFGYEYTVPPFISFVLETDSVISMVVMIIAAVVVAPLAEEFFFRAFTYSALRKRFGVIASVIVTSVYFALIHADFFSYFPIFVLGVALAFLYERRQSIVAPVAMHFFHNARVVGVVLFLKYMNS